MIPSATSNTLSFSSPPSPTANISLQMATQALVNANMSNVLAQQASAQAVVNANLTETLAAVLGGLSALQASVSALAARMDAVEANAALLDSLVVSPPMPPPSPPNPSPPPSPPPPPPSPPPVNSNLGCGACFQPDSPCFLNAAAPIRLDWASCLPYMAANFPSIKLVGWNSYWRDCRPYPPECTLSEYYKCPRYTGCDWETFLTGYTTPPSGRHLLTNASGTLSSPQE